MHRLNVLIYASNSFVSTLNELRPFLKFNHFTSAPNTGYDIIMFHDEVLKDKKIKNLIDLKKRMTSSQLERFEESYLLKVNETQVIKK